MKTKCLEVKSEPDRAAGLAQDVANATAVTQTFVERSNNAHDE